MEGQPLQLGRLRFSDFENFAEIAAGWDLFWQQLDRGVLEAEISRAGNSRTVFSRVALNRRFKQRGSTPRNFVTFGLLNQSAGEIEWCSNQVHAGHLLVFGASQEYESISQPGFSGSTISIDASHLEALASTIGVHINLKELKQGSLAIPANPFALEALGDRLNALDSSIAPEARHVSSDRFRNELEFEIPIRILRAVTSTGNQVPVRIDRKSSKAARRARAYIDANARKPPTILEVCRASGISWRALDYAFQDLYRMTPKQYLQAVRLNGARQDLLRAQSNTSIISVAGTWGFWHMGQFAADYRRHFLERPTETLRRALGNPS